MEDDTQGGAAGRAGEDRSKVQGADCRVEEGRRSKKTETRRAVGCKVYSAEQVP